MSTEKIVKADLAVAENKLAKAEVDLETVKTKLTIAETKLAKAEEDVAKWSKKVEEAIENNLDAATKAELKEERAVAERAREAAQKYLDSVNAEMATVVAEIATISTEVNKLRELGSKYSPICLRFFELTNQNTRGDTTNKVISSSI